MSGGPYRAPSPVDPDEPAPDPRGPWVLQTWTSRRNCVNCNVPLFAARKEGFRIDACGRCGGAWLDASTLERAVAERSLVPAILSEEAAKRAPQRASEEWRRRCPDCGVGLVSEEIAKANVVIDVCRAHGAWFDPDEMRLTIGALVGPPKVDPSVDRIIAEEAKLGALRPPETYDPGTHSLSFGSLFEELVREATRKID